MAAEPTQKLIRDYGIAVATAIAVALLIRFFLIEAYRIPSVAMKPALEPGDVIFVAKWPYGIRFPGSPNHLTTGRPPHYGEVVVFSLPSDPGRDYIKRVVALAGDTIEIRDGKVILNGELRTQPVDKNSICGREKIGTSFGVCWEPPVMDNYGPEKVPENSVFVLGDLRSQVADLHKQQRGWGVVPIQSLKAQAMWIWLSIEPPTQRTSVSWFSRIRFERMFHGIE